jgi:predicted amidohydrolase YtcJ
MRLAAFFLALLAAPALAQPLALPDGPPYVVTDAQIYTVDETRPLAEAMAVGEDGRIAAIGTEAEVLEAYADWPRYNARGRTIIPGLIDAHAHLLNLGTSLLQADLMGTASTSEVLQRLREFEAGLPPDAWLIGRGWDQNDWPARADGSRPFPTRQTLDAVFANRPVVLTRVDGHAIWANSAALIAAGLDPDIPAPADPEGGQIIRDDRGRPTGVFVDAAEELVVRAVPAPDRAFYTEALERALAETTRHGLTGVHEAGITLDQIDLYRAFASGGRFPIRNYAMVSQSALADFCEAYPEGVADDRLVVRSVKLYADGALGSRGAALLADYSDEPGNTGLLIQTPEALTETVTEAMACGLQVNTHAIGDRGARAVLDAYADAMEATAAAAGRHRVEHAQVVTLEDIERMADLGLVASVQPTHATSDMPWAEDRVGPDRVKGAYAWRRWPPSRRRTRPARPSPPGRRWHGC